MHSCLARLLKSCLTLQHFLHVDLLVLTARPESASAPAAVDDSALVNAAASAYFLRASADPEHRVGTPEHYDRDYPFLRLATLSSVTAHSCFPCSPTTLSRRKQRYRLSINK